MFWIECDSKAAILCTRFNLNWVTSAIFCSTIHPPPFPPKLRATDILWRFSCFLNFTFLSREHFHRIYINQRDSLTNFAAICSSKFTSQRIMTRIRKSTWKFGCILTQFICCSALVTQLIEIAKSNWTGFGRMPISFIFDDPSDFHFMSDEALLMPMICSKFTEQQNIVGRFLLAFPFIC